MNIHHFSAVAALLSLPLWAVTPARSAPKQPIPGAVALNRLGQEQVALLLSADSVYAADRDDRTLDEHGIPHARMTRQGRVFEQGLAAF